MRGFEESADDVAPLEQRLGIADLAKRLQAER